MSAATRAALVVLVLAAACSPGPAATTTTGGGRLIAAAPSGRVAWPFTFRWTGADASTVIMLRVYDDAERRLYTLQTRGSEIAAPRDLRPLLHPGLRYLWSVARVDENGEESDASAMQTFELGI